MSIASQIGTLISLGVHELAGTSADQFRELGAQLGQSESAVVAVHPSLVPPSQLAALLRRNDKAGFVVVDMPDLDEFDTIAGVEVPEQPLYLLHEIDRGDDLRNWSPHEAYVEFRRRGTSPLTISEGISWLLTAPQQLEANHCFMTIASRKIKDAKGTLDARTPAIWISGGTGRDGPENKEAPKVGWCWAGNRHTWLGFASVTGRAQAHMQAGREAALALPVTGSLSP
ncbi:MAG: DUF5701 family protein [Actinomycetota bacterium]|nr:DUF5701 family protein [Actinomycetota bacterium]MDP2287897.1 DUF5701 family protein [Actinomycetota bacterium]